jgi:hypothetical protein
MEPAAVILPLRSHLTNRTTVRISENIFFL